MSRQLKSNLKTQNIIKTKKLFPMEHTKYKKETNILTGAYRMTQEIKQLIIYSLKLICIQQQQPLIYICSWLEYVTVTLLFNVEIKIHILVFWYYLSDADYIYRFLINHVLCDHIKLLMLKWNILSFWTEYWEWHF